MPYYSTIVNLLILFIPFFYLVYLKPDLKHKIMGYFQQIDQKPLYTQNINDLMMGYMDSRNNNLSNYKYGNQNNYSNFNSHYPQNNRLNMNPRMNMINPKILDILIEIIQILIINIKEM